MAVEKAVRGAPASLATVVAAVRAVAGDVKPGNTPDADFLTATAEGLVFEALVHTMGLVHLSLCHPPDVEALMLTLHPEAQVFVGV